MRYHLAARGDNQTLGAKGWLGMRYCLRRCQQAGPSAACAPTRSRVIDMRRLRWVNRQSGGKRVRRCGRGRRAAGGRPPSGRRRLLLEAGARRHRLRCRPRRAGSRRPGRAVRPRAGLAAGGAGRSRGRVRGSQHHRPRLGPRHAPARSPARRR